MNEMNDILCSSTARGVECFHSSPLREKSYSPKRRISLANPQHIELAKLNFDYSSQMASAKLSPRSQFQVVGNYDVLKTIGKGQFGKVKLAKHVLTNDLVAVKVINKQKLDQAGKKIFEMEMSVMKKLSHPNIIRLYEVIETDKFYFLFMEYASGGEVLDYIVMHQSLSEKKARNLFRQIISAISYCHKSSIVHRDLKGENLLLDSNLTIKVIDFGLSNKWSANSFLKTACGSPLYASPEIIEHKEYIGPEVDIWSMGVLLYVFLTGLPPFEGDDLLSLYNKILNCDYKIPEDKKLTNDCKDILSRILVLDPSSRANMEEIINHPWVKGEDNWQPLESSYTPITVDSIDKNLLIQLEYLGYSKESVIDSLINSKFNSPSAIYYLLQSKRNQQNDLLSLSDSAGRVLKMGSNPVSSLQRKRAELNNEGLVSGRRRANSECPEYTIVPVPVNQPPIHRKRSQSRNETQIRNATSHLVNHCNNAQFSPVMKPIANNLQTTPSEAMFENLQSAVRRASTAGYGVNRVKNIYRNEIVHDERDEIKRNTDDNIVFIRNLKDRTQKLVNNNNNINNNNAHNIDNSSEINNNVDNNVNNNNNNNSPVRRARGSSIPLKVTRTYQYTTRPVTEDESRDEIKQTPHDMVHSTPRMIQSNVPMKVIPIESTGSHPIVMKNLEARRCRSVNVNTNSDKEKETAPIILNFLNVEGKKGRSTSPNHIPHQTIPINANNNNNNNNNNEIVAQPKQLTESEYEELKHRLEEEKKQVSGSLTPPSSNWQSFLSWTKQLLQTRAENDKPRSVRTVFNNSMTSNKLPQEILAEIKRVLMKFHLPFEHNSPYSLKAVDPTKKVHFEVEVCQLPKISQMYVRINRIAGKWEDYKELCENVVSQLDL